MSEFVFKLPDLGEGMVEAEIVEWHVKPGDLVAEDTVVVDVMTDKANVEVPAPVAGRVLRTTGEPGDVVAVGSELLAIETTGAVADDNKSAPPGNTVDTEDRDQNDTRVAAAAQEASEPNEASEPHNKSGKPAGSAGTPSTGSARSGMALDAEANRQPAEQPQPTVGQQEPSPSRAKVTTSPAIRRLAVEKGIDLASVPGSGPRGRILRRDIQTFLEGGASGQEVQVARSVAAADGRAGTTDIKVIGVRRVIANRMSEAKRTIPHFTYVEEVNLTALESLRGTLNAASSNAAQTDRQRPALTPLPFVALALIRALPEFPMCNAHFDNASGVLSQHTHVHLGIATQTPDGLKVPVVRDAHRMTLRTLAAGIAEVAQRARDGSATKEQLAGSTITVTSLGRLGGIVSTPVINLPEVAILGVNKAVKRPVVIDDAVVVRTMMNLSSSFDHRFVDGFDAASLIQRVKAILEEPALLFFTDD